MFVKRWVALAALWVGILVMAAAPGAQSPPRLRVMTWNIAAGNGDLSRIANEIRAAAPDITALQEVDVHWSERSNFADQAARLAEATGMQARFAPIYQLPGAAGAPAREYGLALLSRHPIVEFRNHVIPRLSTQSAATEPDPMPGFLEAVIEIGQARVRIFNTHLDYRADPRVRSLQVAAMLELMRGASGPTLLAGDLNAPPAAAELAPLFQRLKDAWTQDAGAGLTYPAAAPLRRIDYILMSDAWRALSAQTIETSASDHRPVVADLALR